MGMGSGQAISAAWLSSKMEDHKRPVALAAYVMSLQLANFPGSQLFRDNGMLFQSPDPANVHLPSPCYTLLTISISLRRPQVHARLHRGGRVHHCRCRGGAGLEGPVLRV